MADTLTATEVLIQAGITSPGEPVHDRRFNVDCPDCTSRQTLAQAEFAADEDHPGVGRYSCRRCGAVMVTTRPAGTERAEVHAAYRFGDYVIDLRTDLRFRTGDQMLVIQDLIP